MLHLRPCMPQARVPFNLHVSGCRYNPNVLAEPGRRAPVGLTNISASGPSNPRPAEASPWCRQHQSLSLSTGAEEQSGSLTGQISLMCGGQ